jgi:hypothetical protein
VLFLASELALQGRVELAVELCNRLRIEHLTSGGRSSPVILAQRPRASREPGATRGGE